MGPDGREQTLYVLGQGEPFCLCSLVDTGEYPAYAAALTQTRILTFPAASLAEAARQDPEVLFDLLRLMSLTDALTGIANRRAFDEHIRQAVAEAVRDRRRLSLFMRRPVDTAFLFDLASGDKRGARRELRTGQGEALAPSLHL